MRELGSVIKEILNNIGDGIMFVDRDYKIVFANRALLQICGQEEQGVIGQECYKLFQQSPMPCHEKGTSIICPHHKVFKTGKTITTIYTHTMPDGTEKVFDITASPFKDEKGNVIQVIEILRDVTEKKKAEDITKSMLDNVMIGITMISPKMEVIWMNEIFKETFPDVDIRKKPLCYQSFYSPPKEEICDYCPSIKAFKTGEIHSSETGVCANGKTYNLIAKPVKDKKGKINYVIETVEDITERKKSEEEVCRYGERLRILSEIDHAIITTQSADKIARVALSRIIELVPAQRVSLSLFDFDAEEVMVFAVHTTGKTKVGAGKRFSLKDFGIAKEILKGKMHVVEDISSVSPLPLIDKNLKAEGIRSYTLIPLYFQGELIGSLNMGKDTVGAFAPEAITIANEVADLLAMAIRSKQAEKELRQSEEEFRLLFETALDAIFWADPKTGLIINCNKAAETLLEKKREEIIGCSQAMLHPPQKSKHYSEMFRKHIAEEGAVDDEAEVITKSGKIKPIHITAAVTSIGEKQIIQGIFRDITERKKADEELKTAIIKAEEEKAKSEAIVTGIGDALSILDINYVIRYQNQASKNLLGDHISEFCYKAYKGADQVCEGCPVAVSLKDGKIHRTERSWSTDKGVTHLEITASPLRDSTGKTIGGIEVIRDVTERKWMEKALQEEKNKLQAIVEAMEYGLTIQDRDYNIIYQNKVIKKTFGRLGEKCYRVYEGKNRVCNECPVEIAYRDGKSHTSERHVTMPSGESAYWENTANPIRNAEGEVVACLEIARNITERKKSEDALRESEEIFKNLSEKSPNMIYINKKGRVVYANKKCEEIIGYTKEEFYSEDFDFMKLISPDFRDLVKENFKRHMTEEEIQPYEYKLLTKNGKEIIAINTTKLVDFKGERAILGIITDITERKQAEEALRESEERFRQFFENEPEYCYMVSPEGVIFDVNKSALEVLGYKKDELVGKPLKTIYAPESLPKMELLFEKWRKNGKLQDEEVVIITKQRDRRTVLLNAEVVKGENGKTLCSMSVQTDITEKLRLENTLKHRIKELEEFYDMAVGRELKMKELKEEIERLKEKLKNRK